MTTQATSLAEAFVQTINVPDADAFLALFADNAAVDDAGRMFNGRDAIAKWSTDEIFAAQVTMEILESAAQGDTALISTKVDGNFDRTGLPDPVIIEQRIEAEGGKIVRLTCRLAQAPATA